MGDFASSVRSSSDNTPHDSFKAVLEALGEFLAMIEAAARREGERKSECVAG